MENEQKIHWEKGNEQPENSQKKVPYFDKGGHFLRGQYWKAINKLVDGTSAPSCRSMIAVPVTHASVSWQRRHFMPRHGTQDGRR